MHIYTSPPSDRLVIYISPEYFYPNGSHCILSSKRVENGWQVFEFDPFFINSKKELQFSMDSALVDPKLKINDGSLTFHNENLKAESIYIGIENISIVPCKFLLFVKGNIFR